MKILLLVFYFSIPPAGSYTIIAGTLQSFATMEACLTAAGVLDLQLGSELVPYDYKQNWYLVKCFPSQE